MAILNPHEQAFVEAFIARVAGSGFWLLWLIQGSGVSSRESFVIPE